MKKFTLSLLLLLVLFSCNDNDSFEISEYYTKAHPVFTGIDSILYVEYYVKLKENVGFFDSEDLQREADVRLKIIDREGQSIATIWELNSAENTVLDFNYCFALNYSKESKTLTIGYVTPLYDDQVEFKIMVMDLSGNVLKNFSNNDLINIANYPMVNFPVSPNGSYYALGNRIKSISGEVVKVLSDTVMDWNSNGILVRNNIIDSVRIEIEGTEYDVYSHPKAHLWYGTEKLYLFFDKDTINIYRWPDSSFIEKHVFYRDYSQGYYSPYGGYGDDSQYNAYGLVSSSISPDMNFIVYETNGIYLYDLNSGASKKIVPGYYTYRYDSE
ncbi:MAG TPA: hypothetical protein VEP89_11750 [Draconibacterium sp.]|nr:hypothetical protein [Draconibacterium sp.]